MSFVLVAASFRSWAPMFSNGSCSSISLAIVTPSLVIVGGPNFLSRTTLRPLGPRVILTASANASIPRLRARRASSLYSSCLAGIKAEKTSLVGAVAEDDGQNVGLAENQQFVLVGLFLGRVGQDDAALGDLFTLQRLDHDAVAERAQIESRHDWYPSHW